MFEKLLSSNDMINWLRCPRSAAYEWMNYEKKPNPLDAYHKRERTEVWAEARHVLPESALIRSDMKHSCFGIRPDALIEVGEEFHVILIATKVGDYSLHAEGKMLITFYGQIRSEWKELVQKLTYDVAVLQRIYPDRKVVPWILMPDKAKELTQVSSSIPGIQPLSQRRRASPLRFFNAENTVNVAMDEVSQAMAEMAVAKDAPLLPRPRLRYGCRNCAYRTGNPGSGFYECWGALAEPDPHIFDCYQLYSLKEQKCGSKLLADRLIDEGKTSLHDIRLEDLHGDHKARQQMQLSSMESGVEIIDPGLKQKFQSLNWPIGFLDFETTQSAVPWYKGLRPAEVLPFQFSLNKLNADGSHTHKEWLNRVDQEPTVPFILALRGALNGVRSVLIYTDYEIKVLNDALERIRRLYPKEKKLIEWIEELLQSDRLVDQHDWVYRYHMHPAMKGGRSSLKAVLPAIWQEDSPLHHHPEFRRYFLKIDGKILDPYKTLRSHRVEGALVEVQEGCGAMSAYGELIRGKGSTNPIHREALVKAMLDYCRLDTASQWILFEHWRNRFNL